MKNLKKYMIVIILFCFCYNTLIAQITEEEAIQKAWEFVENRNLNTFLLYFNQKTVTNNDEISTFNKIIIFKGNQSYAFFIDEGPLKNWSHECTYLFIGCKDGEIQTVNWKLPPNNLSEWKCLNEINEPPIKLFNYRKI